MHSYSVSFPSWSYCTSLTLCRLSPCTVLQVSLSLELHVSDLQLIAVLMCFLFANLSTLILSLYPHPRPAAADTHSLRLAVPEVAFH